MMTDQRREDLARRIADMGRYRPLAGAVVLEIGADAKSFAAQMLLDAGAARVISSNHGERWPEETIGAIEKKRIDARKLTDVLAPQSVDIVFGIAVLEHIDGLAEFFATAKKVLRPGGLFFVQGEPIWTTHNGHHVGVIGEKAHYRFGVPGANPIPRWAHLTNTRETLPGVLEALDVYPPDAQKIADYVYTSPKINRVGYKTMCQVFDASPLTLIERKDNAFKPPPTDTLDAILRGTWGSEERYDVSGITFVAN